jgi:peptide/nickel transport system ATP-binding protein
MHRLQADSVGKEYVLRGPLGGERGRVTALVGFSMVLEPGESLAVIGPSGSGKTTAARCLAGWIAPSAGRVLFEGSDLQHLRTKHLRRLRPQFQFVTQDPLAALNPRLRVAAALREPLELGGLATGFEAEHRVSELLREVGLDPELGRRFPFQLSGGQRQRVGLARALAGRPKLLIADEPLASLDAGSRQRIQDLIGRWRREQGLSLVLISHELGAVRQMVDRVIVLRQGRVVRQGETEAALA